MLQILDVTEKTQEMTVVITRNALLKEGAFRNAIIITQMRKVGSAEVLVNVILIQHVMQMLGVKLAIVL